MNRRFGQRPDPARYYKPRPGAYAVIFAADGILVTFQEEPEAELQLPGGGVDPGEGMVQALHREVLEETGYTIHSLRRMGMYHNYRYMPEYDLWAQKQCHVYVARAGRRLGPPREAGHWPFILPWEDVADDFEAHGRRGSLNFLMQAVSLALD